MYDIHCHILPDIDDGADDINDSRQLCTIAVNQGINTIIATPHFVENEMESDKNEVIEKTSLLNEDCIKRDVSLTILTGMEIYFSPNIVELYEKGVLLTLNNTKYILIELPMYSQLPPYFEDVIFHLKIKGLIPVLAHPERYKCVIEEPNLVCDFIESGCVIQVNCGSIDGMFGKTVQKTAHTLLKHNMVHIIASDNHSISKRVSFLGNTFNTVSEKYGHGFTDNLFINNPLKIIKGETIETGKAVKIKKNLFKFWHVK
ncbi:tyrosine-protein phosphatase YwqE [Oxobacter pfennigii]|uniref:protein-tyrosine-phosphatase n=1 Tax=Oxobacter pfennigii TaxID=36849 RepID=A0A0P8YD42_9CLOT|nr:CpsB/CapC family capsule biosynthesis tyrosine phosphatase [Oxobacter pfennigii]KPU45154.1 tyrosine-protein phosphatase YwqE [Oxobacter pfennigii]